MRLEDKTSFRLKKADVSPGQCLAARIASFLIRKRSAWRMDLSLKLDNANQLTEEEHEEALLMLLGRGFEVLIGLLLMPAEARNYKQLCMFSSRNEFDTGDAVTPWKHLAQTIYGCMNS